MELLHLGLLACAFPKLWYWLMHRSSGERLWQQVQLSGSTAKKDLASFNQMTAATTYSFI